MGELILMSVGRGGSRVVGRAQLVDPAIEPFPMRDRVRRFVLFPARTWLHVGERMSNGQLTARWSKRVAGPDAGAWFTAEGWKRPNKRGRLAADQVATVEELIKLAPTEAEEKARIDGVIEQMRRDDREFITEETVGQFAGVDTIEARLAIERVFGAREN